MKREAGFTLIELVVVIVVLGVLSAVALPKFVNLRSDAEHSVVDSFVGSLKEAQNLALAKLMVCGAADYSSTNFVDFWNYVQLDNTEPAPGATCSTFVGTDSGGGNTIGLNSMRDSIFQYPNGGTTASNEAQAGNTITFLTKTGRTVTITHANSGGISWSATPAY